MKRFFDLIFTIPGLVILLPFFIIIAFLIKIDSRGPVFYLQERVGKNGRLFKIYKFRTMVNDADRIGPAITVGDDLRITRLGYSLRKHKLDELPQLINVFKGEMSLVGPRPEVPKYVCIYTDDQKAVLNLLPGITDPASIKYRNENELLAATSAEGIDFDPEYIYINEIMPDKIRVNLEYAARAGILSDFLVVMRTILG
ncbi:MAG: sugar transferase [Syntrophomonadaceae bacterium]|nr:sugar transferase [Syntrophomonadaceae bacterium]